MFRPNEQNRCRNAPEGSVRRSCIELKGKRYKGSFIGVTAADLLAAATDAIVGAVPSPIPGAVLGVVTTTGDRAVGVFGLAQTEPTRAPMQRGTWFDLASLTKVLFTTPKILELVTRHQIGLDGRLIE